MSEPRQNPWDEDFDAAFVALHARAYQVAFQLLGSQSDAEDVAQEALIRAYVRWPAFDGRGPEGWVTVVAARLAIDAHRRGLRRRLQPSPARQGSDGEAYALERLALRAALATLPARQREVVVLRYFADMSEPDVASALGLSVNSVKTHTARGCARLRGCLRSDPSPEVTDVPAPG